ncbi:MAG: class I SAM-dependent methyltransferase [Acidobacteria bacterium]|nr:class I SAM-dependent methyltransferase [Acidobacteriota bacterium]
MSCGKEVLDEDRPRECPICKGQEVAGAKRLGTLEVTPGPVRGRGLGPELFDLVCCPGCELIFLSPLPPQEMLDALYINSPQFDGSVYGGSRAKVIVEVHRLRLQEIRTQQLMRSYPQWLWKVLKQWVIRYQGARVLEIGSGLSWMSRAAKILIARTTTVAQDISSEAAESCPWVDRYFVGTLESKAKEIQALAPYDVISMTHVIEHLPDPVQVLRRCSALLAERGMVFVSAPFRPAGWSPAAPFDLWKHWGLNHTPAHLQYFNRRSLERCAFRSGLRLARYEPDGEAFVAWLKRG